MGRILISAVLLIFLFAGSAYYFLNHQAKIVPLLLPSGNFCDPDSMTCSDGTVLKRIGPKCEFPPCPSPESAMPSASSQGNYIKISGTMICLPYVNSEGPQTLECALGLKGEDGNNYGLNDPGWKYLIGVGNGTQIEIKGTLTKKTDTKYDSAGVIEIENLVKK